jgi:hypothetical protein
VGTPIAPPTPLTSIAQFCVVINLGGNLKLFFCLLFVLGYKIKTWRQGEFDDGS